MLTNLLQHLDDADRERLLASGTPRELAPGDEIARQGTVGDRLYVVESGELAVIRRVPGNEEELIETASPGTLVGELAVFDRRPRSASLRAQAPSSVRAISLTDFEALAFGDPAGVRILDAVALSLHDRLAVARAAVARRFESASPATWSVTAPIVAPRWEPPPGPGGTSLKELAAFSRLDSADVALLAAEMPQAMLPRNAQFRFSELERPTVVLLRGALSPCLPTTTGEAIALPVVAPGGFVDYSIRRARAGPEPFWRTRSEVLLCRLPARCLEEGTPRAARLLYALCRDLAQGLRSTTGLLMHLGMQWGHARTPTDTVTRLSFQP